MSDLRLDHIECADALTYLRGLPDACAAAVITDPPYGIDVDDAQGRPPGMTPRIIAAARTPRRGVRPGGRWLALVTCLTREQKFVKLRE